MADEDQQKETAEEQWLEPSNVGGEFMRHQAAMEPASRVPVGKAFGIPAGYDVGMLRKLANEFKPKKIVVIDHGENGFEVRRMPDKTDVEYFYISIDPAKTKQLKSDPLAKSIKRADYVKKTICDFLETTIENIVKYDPRAAEARDANCITHAYLQRRCAGISAFKNANQGGSKALSETLEALEADGVLRKLSEEETQQIANTSATFYRINKEGLQ